MEKKVFKKVEIEGSCLQAVAQGVMDIHDCIDRFKNDTRIKLEHLYMPIDAPSFGMRDMDGVKIQMHNLGRSIENIELWVSLTEMLIENMEDDLKTIAAVQRVRHETRAAVIAEEISSDMQNRRREQDKLRKERKRNADRAAS